MVKSKPCTCRGNDKNCYKCGGTGNPLLLKRATSYNQPYSPRLQKIPSQVEDPGYRSQPSVMRAGSTKGLSSSSKLKCSHCNEVFSGLLAIQNHTFFEHAIAALMETLSIDQVRKQTQLQVRQSRGTFVEVDSLGKNSKKLHIGYAGLLKPQKKISCHLCKKLCNGRVGLVNHVRVVHPESLSADGKSYAT